MPITVEVIDETVTSQDIDRVYAYFTYINETFSTFKKMSEISQINDGKISGTKYSADMKIIFSLAEKTRRETGGYFDIHNDGKIDPSGIVKGWAIYNAATLLKKSGFKNYFVDAGGDVQVSGFNERKMPWKVGIRNPFNRGEIVKVIYLKDKGIATSGTYIRGQHIYNPKQKNSPVCDIVSLTVIGPNVFEADRFATPAFAMGKAGIKFISRLSGFEGYMIDKDGIATYTSGFNTYTTV